MSTEYAFGVRGTDKDTLRVECQWRASGSPIHNFRELHISDESARAMFYCTRCLIIVDETGRLQ